MSSKRESSSSFYLWFGIFATTVISCIPLSLWLGTDFEKPKTLNGVGDFLAGFAAIIGVLWLVLSVLIQKEELSQSLNEFEATANAMRDQVDVARGEFTFNLPPSYSIASDLVEITDSGIHLHLYLHNIEGAGVVGAIEFESDIIGSTVTLHDYAPIYPGETLQVDLDIVNKEETRKILDRKKIFVLKVHSEMQNGRVVKHRIVYFNGIDCGPIIEAVPNTITEHTTPSPIELQLGKSDR
ncbi:hypothetical protein V22_15760 [Calycomorphotria hydatis]|uniref:Uncharacterized protein n=2 Tax=Calycomorphotria hydatis TaxID=2528027 RepID=A0A517T7J2_9PLAN|nr:hypothetical protein V22_15760 [Calycomorphotria hydatis]